jgi:hypothetical protein
LTAQKSARQTPNGHNPPEILPSECSGGQQAGPEATTQPAQRRLTSCFPSPSTTPPTTNPGTRAPDVARARDRGPGASAAGGKRGGQRPAQGGPACPTPHPPGASTPPRTPCCAGASRAKRPHPDAPSSAAPWPTSRRGRGTEPAPGNNQSNRPPYLESKSSPAVNCALAPRIRTTMAMAAWQIRCTAPPKSPPLPPPAKPWGPRIHHLTVAGSGRGHPKVRGRRRGAHRPGGGAAPRPRAPTYTRPLRPLGQKRSRVGPGVAQPGWLTPQPPAVPRDPWWACACGRARKRGHRGPRLVARRRSRDARQAPLYAKPVPQHPELSSTSLKKENHGTPLKK